MFHSAKEGNEKISRVLARYDSMIGAKRRKEQLKDMIRKEVVSNYSLIQFVTI